MPQYIVILRLDKREHNRKSSTDKLIHRIVDRVTRRLCLAACLAGMSQSKVQPGGRAAVDNVGGELFK